MIDSSKISRLFVWPDVIFGVLPAGIVAVLLYANLQDIRMVSWVYRIFVIDPTSIYPLSAVMAATMTSISMAVTMLAVQLWRTEWFFAVMQDYKVVGSLWLSLRQFTWSMASLTVVCLLATFVDPSGQLGDGMLVIYVGWLGACMARAFHAIQYLHLMVLAVVSATASNTKY